MENVYAALLLHKLGKEVNEENLKKVVVAAGADLSRYLPFYFKREEDVRQKTRVG